MDQQKTKEAKYQRRHRRIRAKISGTGSRPRLAVFRSLQHIYAQLIDDEKGQTLLQVSDKEIKEKMTKSQRARAVGKLLAEKAKAQKITVVVFDRGGFLYHGRVKELAEGAREGGLKF